MRDSALPRDEQVVNISGESAVRIAQGDAEKTYGDLSAYRIDIALHLDGWHVDYQLTNPLSNRGGPHYVIDTKTGVVVSKRYEQ